MNPYEQPGGADSRQAGPMHERYVLRLFVTGMSPRSTEALATVKAICEEHLRGRYDLEVIDIYQQPALAREDGVFAAPTLIRKRPEPVRHLTGNLSQRERVLSGLDLSRN